MSGHVRIKDVSCVDAKPALSRIARLGPLSVTPESRRYVLITLCPVLGAVLNEVLSHNDARECIWRQQGNTV